MNLTTNSTEIRTRLYDYQFRTAIHCTARTSCFAVFNMQTVDCYIVLGYNTFQINITLTLDRRISKRHIYPSYKTNELFCNNPYANHAANHEFKKIPSFFMIYAIMSLPSFLFFIICGLLWFLRKYSEVVSRPVLYDFVFRNVPHPKPQKATETVTQWTIS